MTTLALTPASAQAYLMPLLGAGGVIATALAGLFAMLFSAIYLVAYKLRRSFKRLREKQGSDTDRAP